MAFWLLDSAQTREDTHLVAVARAGGSSADGALQERPASPDGSEEASFAGGPPADLPGTSVHNS